VAVYYLINGYKTDRNVMFV